MVRYVLPLILSAVFANPAFADEGTPEKLVLRVSMAGVSADWQREKATKPRTAKSMEELKKLLGESNAKKLESRIDCGTHDFVLFQWAGSGQDKIKAVVKKDKDAVVFQYQRGLTRDLRRHRVAFAVKKGTEWKVTSKFRLPGKKL